MAKRIIPHKLVVSYDDRGEVLRAVLQYRTAEGARIEQKFNTMAVTAAVKGLGDDVLFNATKHAEVGERIITTEAAELAKQNRAAAKAAKTEEAHQ